MGNQVAARVAAYRRNGCRQIHFLHDTFGAVFASAVHRRAERGIEGDAHQARRDIGAVIDILIQAGNAPLVGAHQADGVYFEQNGNGAAFRRNFGVKRQ